MIVAIHQPNFIPWLGYFRKMVESDVFIMLDNVQYTKNSFINRNKIKTPQGDMWLTVPVAFKFGELINEVKINNESNWRKRHLKTLEMDYKKTEFFEQIVGLIEEIYYYKDWQNLCEFNTALVKSIAFYLGLDKKIVNASDLKVHGKSTELLIQIVKQVNGETYLSGSGGTKYQEEDTFVREGIGLQYCGFVHPIYPQQWGDFIPNLSIIDLLFNCGPSSQRILLGK